MLKLIFAKYKLTNYKVMGTYEIIQITRAGRGRAQRL